MPETSLQILQFGSVCLYLRILITELNESNNASIFYHSRFIGIAETFYEHINDLGDQYKEVRSLIMQEILSDKQKSKTTEGRILIKERIRKVTEKFTFEDVRKKWLVLASEKDDIGYNAAFITHPKDN